MIFLLKISSGIAVYHFGGKLLSYVHERKGKSASKSIRHIILSSTSILLSASYFTTLLLIIGSIFSSTEMLMLEHSITFFSSILALMIGIELTNENPPDLSIYLKTISILFLLGLAFWPMTYALGQLMDNSTTTVNLFAENGIVEFSVWMILLTFSCPTILELTERYL